MTARSAATIVSLVLLGAVSACTNFYEIPIETPIQPKMDVSAFQRVLIAGFITGGTEDVDANMETVRLLRSQLRTKSNLRVIEAEVLPLVELASEQTRAAEETAASNGTVPPLPNPDGSTSAPAPAAPPNPAAAGSAAPRGDETPKPREKDIEKYQAII